MKLWFVVVIGSVVSARVAVADPILIGAGVGVIRDHDQHDASSTLGVFGRARLDHRASAQLELARIAGKPSIDAKPGAADTTQTTALVIGDLGDGGVVPVVLAGVGLDFASTLLRDNTYVHGEVGGGLELRSGALTVGGDVRIGARTIVAATVREFEAVYEPRVLTEGAYASARLLIGLRF